VALAEMSVQGRKGVTVDVGKVPNKTSRMDTFSLGIKITIRP